MPMKLLLCYKKDKKTAGGLDKVLMCSPNVSTGSTSDGGWHRLSVEATKVAHGLPQGASGTKDCMYKLTDATHIVDPHTGVPLLAAPAAKSFRFSV